MEIIKYSFVNLASLASSESEHLKLVKIILKSVSFIDMFTQFNSFSPKRLNSTLKISAFHNQSKGGGLVFNTTVYDGIHPAYRVSWYSEFPPSMMISPCSRRGTSLAMKSSTALPALTNIITFLNKRIKWITSYISQPWSHTKLKMW